MTRPARGPQRRQALRWLGSSALTTLNTSLASVLTACGVLSDSRAPAGTPGATAGATPGTAGPAGRASPVAGTAPEPAAAESPTQPPPPPREFRAAWVATVANIDWPSRPGLDAAAMRAEALALLDRARALNLNALILQVRPAADAIYPSALEPWSEVLSGEQGRAPWAAGEAAWDPLAFWVREAHLRGLELHAWFNPYRARHSAMRSPPVAPHPAVSQPGLVRRYGDLLWMDPGEPGAAAHTLAVVLDVLRRYDIDGVHIDDYFYPYPVTVDGVEQPFPDDAAWARAQLSGATAPPTREDWRRANVSALVKAMHEGIHALKPWVRFGISPFGLPRPDRRPPEVSGFSQYDKLYADVELWLEQGWLDYLAPQLYWPLDRAGQAFGVLLGAWAAQRAASVAMPSGGRWHLWPGLFTSSVRANPTEAFGPRAWPARELIDQVNLLRREPQASGHIHFSLIALMQDRDGLATLLQFGPYAQPALPPATTWLSGETPPAPRLHAEGPRLRIEPTAAVLPGQRWALWRRSGGRWRFALLPGPQRIIAPEGGERFVIAGVGRTGLIGAWTTLVVVA